MEQVALRLAPAADWMHLGGEDEPRKPLEVVVRAFEGDVLFATGATAEMPGADDPVHVPEGRGARLSGAHFFVRPAAPGSGCLLSYRGI
jgi:hypothetical protein